MMASLSQIKSLLNRWSFTGPRMNTCVVLGDSLSQNNHASGLFTWVSEYLDVANTLMGQRLNVLNVQGASGYKTDQVQQFILSARRYYPGWAIEMSGINDMVASVSAAASFKNRRQTWERMGDFGIKVIAATIIPSNWMTTAAQYLEWSRHNDMVRNYCAAYPNTICWDTAPGFIDYTNAAPVALAGLTSDGAHPNSKGGLVLGKSLRDRWSPLLQTVPRLYSWQGDTLNALGTRGMFTGTTGTLASLGSTATTGFAATGWTVQQGDAGVAAGIVASKVARTDGLPGEWQQCVLSGGTGVYGGGQIRIFTPVIALPSTAVGDQYECWVEFETSNDWVTPMRGPVMLVQFIASNGSTVIATLNNFWTSTTDPIGGRPESGIIRSFPYTLTGTEVNVRVFIDTTIASGTLRVSRADVRKLTPLT